jgi:hypothetical protein
MQPNRSPLRWSSSSPRLRLDAEIGRREGACRPLAGALQSEVVGEQRRTQPAARAVGDHDQIGRDAGAR